MKIITVSKRSRFKQHVFLILAVLFLLSIVLWQFQTFSTIKFFFMMAETKPWTQVDNRDPYGRELVKQTKEVACFLLRHSEKDRRTLISSYNALIHRGAGASRDAKLHLLLRLIFDVPQAQPTGEAAIFGGWMGEGSPYPYHETQYTNLLWPLSTNMSKLVIKVGHTSYIGAPYNGLAEYDYFVSKFPLRSEQELGCSQ